MLPKKKACQRVRCEVEQGGTWGRKCTTHVLPCSIYIRYLSSFLILIPFFTLSSRIYFFSKEVWKTVFDSV